MTHHWPRSQTRLEIERDLAAHSDRTGAKRRKAAKVEEHLARLRRALDLAAFARVEAQFREEPLRGSMLGRRSRRRPGEGSMPVPVEPPRGPKPLTGGSAAPLEFD